MENNQTVGQIHCCLTDAHENNYAQGSLDSLLAILAENGVKLRQSQYLSIYQQILQRETVKLGNYLIICLE